MQTKIIHPNPNKHQSIWARVWSARVSAQWKLVWLTMITNHESSQKLRKTWCDQSIWCSKSHLWSNSLSHGKHLRMSCFSLQRTITTRSHQLSLRQTWYWMTDYNLLFTGFNLLVENPSTLSNPSIITINVNLLKGSRTKEPILIIRIGLVVAWKTDLSQKTQVIT